VFAHVGWRRGGAGRLSCRLRRCRPRSRQTSPRFLTTSKLLKVLSGVRRRPRRPVSTSPRGGCELKTLTRHDRKVGPIDDAVWLRMRLRNSSPDDLERWLQLGRPRHTDVTVFQSEVDGRWRSERTGYGVPRVKRSAIAAFYDVVPLQIAAGSTTEIWLRIESRSRVNLEIFLWNPSAYRGFRQTTSVMG